MHKHDNQNEMIGIKFDAREASNVSIAYPYITTRIAEEKKVNTEDKNLTLTYFPNIRYDIAFY